MPAKINRPSLKDIAAQSGVSVSLVSKVLNNRMGNTGVTAELAEQIRTVARDIGYRKNTSAQSLRTGRHDAVGVMIHRHGEAGSPLMENLVWGISVVAREQNQKLLLNFFEEDEEFLEMSRSAHTGMMDGLILGGMIHPDLKSRVLDIQKEGVPVVTIFERPMHPKLLNIGMDQARVAEVPTEHMLQQGCKSIGLIDAHPYRVKGYRRALHAAGLSARKAWIYKPEGDKFSLEIGEKAVRHWLETDTLPEGIVAESDSQALGVINALRDAGLDVPGDVKVSGMDNSPFCEYVRPRITSVSQENRVRGTKAMELILRIGRGKTVHHTDIAPRLVARTSTGHA